jgi:D-alanine-D-alanine ligase
MLVWSQTPRRWMSSSPSCPRLTPASPEKLEDEAGQYEPCRIETMRIGVLFGGPSPEHDVSILTGLQAARALSGLPDQEVLALYWSRSGSFFQVDPALEASAFAQGLPKGANPVFVFSSEEGSKATGAGASGGFGTTGRLGRRQSLGVEVVVNCCHGGPGEDGTLQGLLDCVGLPYTGPDVPGACLGMDKFAFAGAMERAGIPVLPRELAVKGVEPSFPGPYILKPRFGGSSIGIEVVKDASTAWARLGASSHFSQGAVVEPYRPELSDLQIAVLSWPDTRLSAIERPLRGDPTAEILNYRDKYVGGEGMASAPRELPAKLEDSLAKHLRETALTVALVARVRGIARIDFLADTNTGELFVNEVNTIPGSLARYLWIDPPIAFKDLLLGLVREALERPTRHWTSAGADGSVLVSAGSIASKLA